MILMLFNVTIKPCRIIAGIKRKYFSRFTLAPHLQAPTVFDTPPKYAPGGPKPCPLRWQGAQ